MTARALLAAVLLTSLAIPLSAAGARNDAAPTAAILCYHIVESPQDPRMEISRDAFLQQMRYLAMTGYSVIPLRHVYEYAIGKRASLPKNSVVVTIDDGWRSTYTEVFPEMQKRNFPFTVFVYPKIIGQTSHALSWKQLKEMSDAGVDIQSHSLSHPFLTQRRHESLGDARYEAWLQRELSESKRILERATGREVSFLAYPYGDYDRHLTAAVARAGYAAAVTCDFGRVHNGSDPMRMKRFVIDKRMDFAAFRHYLGAGEMKIEGVTPVPGRAVEPVQQPLVVSARIPNYKQIDPASVGMVVLSSSDAVPFNYDARDGSIRLVVNDALDALKGRYLRALVWANDVKSGRRVEATWTFRIPDTAANLRQIPRSIQHSNHAPAASASFERLQPRPAELTKASTAVARADGGAGGTSDARGGTHLDRAPN